MGYQYKIEIQPNVNQNDNKLRTPETDCALLDAMKVLKFCIQLLTVFAVWPLDQSAAIQRVHRIFCYIVLSTAETVMIASSTIFALLNTQDIVAFTDALYVIMAFSTSLALYWALVLNRKHVLASIKSIDRLVNDSKLQFAYISRFLHAFFLHSGDRNYDEPKC